MWKGRGLWKYLLVISKVLVFVCVGVILQSIEWIIFRSKKTALASSGYKDLTKCTRNSGSGSLPLYIEESPDEYVRVQLLGSPVKDALAREFFCYRSCQRNIIRTQKNRGNKEYKTRKECLEKSLDVHQKQFNQ